MSLATRCPHCSTVFKVVQDQLKVSEGWVRCGRCNEVFHALPALFDLDLERPPADAQAQDDQAGIVTDAPAPIDLSAPAPRLPREPEPPSVRPAAIEFDLDLDLDLPDLDENPSVTPEDHAQPEAPVASAAIDVETVTPEADISPVEDAAWLNKPEESTSSAFRHSGFSGRERKI